MDYQLLPHEFMIMHSDHVCFGNSTTLTDELILTNLNLVHIKKGIFGGKKSQQLIPINQIKLFEGKPQVSVCKVNGSKRLEYTTMEAKSFLGSITLKIPTNGLPI